jgi:hypothetical protein
MRIVAKCEPKNSKQQLCTLLRRLITPAPYSGQNDFDYFPERLIGEQYFDALGIQNMSLCVNFSRGAKGMRSGAERMKYFACLLALAFGLWSLGMSTVGAQESSGQPDHPEAAAGSSVLAHTYGIVASRSDWHIELADGRTVDLTKTTAILPIGATIRQGDRIGVFGLYTRPKVLRAASIVDVTTGSAGVEEAR